MCFSGPFKIKQETGSEFTIENSELKAKFDTGKGTLTVSLNTCNQNICTINYYNRKVEDIVKYRLWCNKVFVHKN